VLQGSDSNPGQTEGVFTALLNLQSALTSNDATAAQQAITMLDQSANQVSSARAEMDATMQGLTALQTRQTTNETSLKSSISQNYDVDFASAASQFTQLQIAYQASLQTSAAAMKMTLFSYL
jgi:flagellar hook-associated protein 3 FlgL